MIVIAANHAIEAKAMRVLYIVFIFYKIFNLTVIVYANIKCFCHASFALATNNFGRKKYLDSSLMRIFICPLLSEKEH